MKRQVGGSGENEVLEAKVILCVFIFVLERGEFMVQDRTQL